MSLKGGANLTEDGLGSGNLSVATPYRENSVLAIARAAVTHGRLHRFYTTLHLGQFAESVQRVPYIGSRLGRELGRRAFQGIQPNKMVSVAATYEVAHIAIKRAGIAGSRFLPSDLMYRVKSRFDDGVSRRLDLAQQSAVVGMFGAAKRTFERAGEGSSVRILNFVNSHPEYHNHVLIELAGLTASHHELIPEWVGQRVIDELELADLVLVPSLFVARQLVGRGIPEGKVAVIPYGVDLSRFYPDSFDEDPAELLSFLFVGQISHRKGVGILLEAARQCSQLPVRFRLVGPIVSGEILRDLPENVEYQGPVGPSEVAAVMRESDAFILPSLEDAYPLVTLEAMASGLPVITTRNSGTAELIRDGMDGMVIAPGDSGSLAEAIETLAEDRELLRRMSIKAPRAVASRSWEVYGQAVLGQIDQVIAGAQGNVSQ